MSDLPRAAGDSVDAAPRRDVAHAEPQAQHHQQVAAVETGRVIPARVRPGAEPGDSSAVSSFTSTASSASAAAAQQGIAIAT